MELDLLTLNHYKITAHQYLILHLLYKQKYDALFEYLCNTSFNNEEVFRYDIDILIEKELISKYDYSSLLDIRGYKVTTKGLQIVSEGITDYFDEFLQEYPTKVLRDGGIQDFLKSDLTRCRIKYNKLTKGKEFLHNHILDCLKYEVKHRTNTGTLKYFKKLPKWLDSEEWKAYEEELNKGNDNKIDLGYGNNLE